MEFLIRNIIQRIENMPSSLPEIFNSNRNSVALDPDKHNETSTRKQEKTGCC